MENSIQTDAQAQGATVPPITPELVKEYLTKDLSVAISCLVAIQSDPELLDYLAVFMTGRWQNVQNAKANGSTLTPVK